MGHHASQRPAITPVEVDLRASAVLSSSECLFSGGDDALATHFLALTHHAWPNHDFGATTSSHDQILNQTLNDQILNDSAAVLPTSTHNSPASHCSHHAASPTWCEVCERVVSSASRFFHKRCNEFCSASRWC